MTKRVTRTLVLFLAACLPAAAAERTLTFDPGGSAVRFTLDATMHTVHGSFKLVRGAVTFDAIPGPASGEIVVDATSGETGNGDRDQKMHEKVLTSLKFPEIVLVPSRLSGEVPTSGRGQLVVEGSLRLCGAEHPVKVPVEVEVEGDSVVARGRLSVPFVAWGLDDPSVFVLRVGKEVAVEVEARGTLQPAAIETGGR